MTSHQIAATFRVQEVAVREVQGNGPSVLREIHRLLSEGKPEDFDPEVLEEIEELSNAIRNRAMEMLKQGPSDCEETE